MRVAQATIVRAAVVTPLDVIKPHWARTGMQRDAGSRPYYAALRARGHTHGRALRSVTDRLLRILVTLLKHGHLYNPEHRPSIMTV